MKVLFLDIDGVLNSYKTEERFSVESFNVCGIDPILKGRYLDWLKDKPVSVVLSSMWRTSEPCMEHLRENGINWISTTPIYRHHDQRGEEILQWFERHVDDWMESEQVEAYAILDDNNWFTESQQPYLVQTDARVGLTEENLKQLSTILGV